MTDRAQSPRRRKQSPLPVFATATALFLVAMALLTYQLAQGNDPALGAGVLAAGKAKRPVIVRRIVKRRIVTTVKPAPVAAAVPVSSGSTTTSSASAPVAAPVAAPAPAPAPVVTSSS